MDKSSPTWQVKKFRKKDLQTTAKQVGPTYCSVQEKGGGLVCLLQTKPPQTGWGWLNVLQHGRQLHHHGK